MAGGESTRIDSWLWAVRLFKTRTLATAACRAGHVRLNSQHVKAAQPVRIGDEVRVRQAGRERIVVVTRIISKRVSAEAAAACLDDRTPPPLPRVAVPAEVIRDRGSGRPTKKQRREIERLRGR